jgi:hypothetical protein
MSKLSWKAGVALVIGGVFLGSIVSAVAQDSGEEAKPDDARVGAAHFGKRGPGGPHGRGLVRSEAVVEGQEDGEFNTIKVDRGILKGVEGGTLTIEEADGKTVEVATNDDTKFRRDGEEADLGDLKNGDHVTTFQVKEGDGDFVTKRVKAISAQRAAELEERRQACEDDPAQCRRLHRRMHRGRPGPRGEMSGSADVEPADASA